MDIRQRNKLHANGATSLTASEAPDSSVTIKAASSASSKNESKGVFSRLFGFLFRKDDKLTNPLDFEKRLNDLDSQIQECQVRIADTRLSERRNSIYLFFYSLVVYLACLVYGALLYHSTFHGIGNGGNEEKDYFYVISVLIVIVIVIPLLIWAVRRLLNFYYARTVSNQEALLASLRSKQKLLIEDLKKQTSYYMTKNLLDRYATGAGANTPRRVSLPASAASSQPKSSNQSSHGPTTVNNNPNNNNFNNNPTIASSSSIPILGVNSDFGKIEKKLFTNQTPLFDVIHDNKPPISNTNTNNNNNNSIQRSFWDKLLDSIVGDDPASMDSRQKYALICRKCHHHNGLVTPEEFQRSKYYCPHCKHFNDPSHNNKNNNDNNNEMMLLGKREEKFHQSLPNISVGKDHQSLLPSSNLSTSPMSVSPNNSSPSSLLPTSQSPTR